MKKIERATLVEAVTSRIRDRITSGAWPVGTRIPSEHELAATLEVSRVSVRSAVHGLVEVGLLAARQGDGTYVAARDATEVAIRRRLSEAPRGDAREVRGGFDLVAAGLAATRRTDADLAALRDALDRRRAAAGETPDEAAFVAADVDFHLGVARAAHNELLYELYATFTEALADSVRENRCLKDAAEGAEDRHEALAAAIAAGDPLAATDAVLTILGSVPGA
ncbi:FadR/GntR family transcriptional regulator [Streptomyces sp. NPDC059524]|uniref:FadR/GntR family transcriptional regulator n=1 Tax=Streptomyces sp. NPDC059524 TaxID=3346856 RepID=UPI0036B15294